MSGSRVLNENASSVVKCVSIEAYFCIVLCICGKMSNARQYIALFVGEPTFTGGSAGN